MKIIQKIFTLFAFFAVIGLAKAGALPDAQFYLNYSATGGVDANAFLEKADKSKPVVLHLHGCGGRNSWDEELKKFYMQTFDFYFIYPDEGASCRSGENGTYIYTANPRERIQARVSNVKESIEWLRKKGFAYIVLTGHSEGGMVAQMTVTPVEKTIIHSMGCIRGAREITPVNSALQLVSRGDPSLINIPSLSCRDYLNSEKFEVVYSDVREHGPLADANWKDKIRDYLNKNRQ